MSDDDTGLDPADARWVRPDATGGFAVSVPSGVRAMLVDLVGQLDELLTSDIDAVRRVFPTAYPDDPEREAGYQALVRGELIDRHRAGAELIGRTIGSDRLTEEELTSWMTTINSMRLVFGTALDVRDDEPFEVDLESDQGPAQMAYQVLTELIDDIVHALRSTL